ncbi:serine protease grass-like [Drosophila santomea]|uniref:serine protease grass-like n=1 Tax=Drosophila santomea TaxID=129105 RepID=UPI0019549C31|nr:serine protease grass-like [Drosophila santomea]
MTLLRLLLLALCLQLGQQSGQADSLGNQTEKPYPAYCTTYDQKPGKCVNYKNCQYIAAIVSKPKDQLTAKDLEIKRNALCSANSRRIVCCEESINESGLELLKASESSCGEFGDQKVTGGNEILMGSRPWMALLQFNISDSNKRISFACGGTLITPRYVLTAAHCVMESLYSVRVGEHRISTERDCKTYATREICLPPYQDVPIQESVVHEGYHAKTLHYDIALLRLARSIEFSQFVKPICLPLYEEVRQSIWDKRRPNQKVTGWGIDEQNVLSDVPREGDVTRLNLDQCSVGRNTTILIANQLCVSAFQRDSCQGDSGGPLLYPYLYLGQQRFVQTGIVSKGPMYCGQGSSAIYTDVTRFVPWITQNIKS